MISFDFVHARVTSPDGDTYNDVIASLHDYMLKFKADGVLHTYRAEDAWSHGQKGYGITVEGQGVWYVKRTGGGCGGCGG